MRRDLITSLLAVVVITIGFGIVYPLAVTGVSQVLFPGKANGSEITRGGRVVGSRLLAQDFRVPVLGRNGKPKVDADGNPVLAPDAKYFQPRPSTATNYNPAATAFTNLGPNSKAARDTFKANLAGYLALERPYTTGLTAQRVPVDAVTSSGSGVDPDISAANAAIQAHRIAAVRRLPPATVQRLISANTDGRSFGVLGEPGVNVLALNLALNQATR
ncbi:MAG: potassium-transporting ATPase KdpC subunit [Solirubrobacteraceae bacterium]|nr:potassium-transporting ATPase KdpC subunit [Solirubrobacteraceae bacterium]